MRLILYMCAVLALISTRCNSPQSELRSGSTVAINSNLASNEPSTDVRLRVAVGNKCGYIDGTGKLVINPQFESADDFSEGLARVCVGECDFEHISGQRFKKDGSIEKVEQRFKFGFIDKAGKLIINPMFEYAYDFHEGLAAVCVGQGCYGINFEHPEQKRERKWGYIDKIGVTVIPPQFDVAQDFYEGLAGVSIGGNSGYVDKTGKFVINPQFLYVERFDHGIARVTIGNSDQPATERRGYIDKTGKYIWQPSN